MNPTIPPYEFDGRPNNETPQLKALGTLINAMHIQLSDFTTAELFDEPQRSRVQQKITENLLTLAEQLPDAVQKLH